MHFVTEKNNNREYLKTDETFKKLEKYDYLILIRVFI